MTCKERKEKGKRTERKAKKEGRVIIILFTECLLCAGFVFSLLFSLPFPNKPVRLVLLFPISR